MMILSEVGTLTKSQFIGLAKGNKSPRCTGEVEGKEIKVVKDIIGLSPVPARVSSPPIEIF